MNAKTGPKPKPATLRFWAKVERGEPDQCWNWTAGTVAYGYGRFGFEGRTIEAHVFAYEEAKGPRPAGHHIHHLCDNRACVNPAHLVSLPAREHIAIGNSKKTHCKFGHPFDADNTYLVPNGSRRCRACQRRRDHAYRHSTEEVI